MVIVRNRRPRCEAVSAGRPLVVASLIAFAGLYQFGAIKRASLLRCRSPEGYFLQHGVKFTSTVGSLTIGASYGLLCLACCWGLMIALTAMGTANLAWMAGFAILITLEKLHPAGPAISRATGVALLVIAPLVLVVPDIPCLARTTRFAAARLKLGVS